MGNLKEYSKEIKETAANLRIIDDALFRLMGEKPGVCEEILRTLLDMPHLQVVKVSVQSVVQSFQREITLDALCMTQDGRYCNVPSLSFKVSISSFSRKLRLVFRGISSITA